jgi:hypothetical protein
MPRLTFKETITKEIEIPLDQLFTIIDQLSSVDKEKLMGRLQTQPLKVKPFKKDAINSIMEDFSSLDLYEEGFLKDLEKGLKASSVYKKG